MPQDNATCSQQQYHANQQLFPTQPQTQSLQTDMHSSTTQNESYQATSQSQQSAYNMPSQTQPLQTHTTYSTDQNAAYQSTKKSCTRTSQNLNVPSATSTQTNATKHQNLTKALKVPAKTVAALQFGNSMPVFNIPDLISETNQAVLLDLTILESHFPNFRYSKLVKHLTHSSLCQCIKNFTSHSPDVLYIETPNPKALIYYLHCFLSGLYLDLLHN